jgi:alpha-tubulin suppressor-like RCC1 family protein
VVNKEGRVVCWGSNSTEKSKPPDTLENVVGVSCSQGNTVALTADGAVVSWGLLCSKPRSLPSDAIAICSRGCHYAVTTEGKVIRWVRCNSCRTPCVDPPETSNIVSVCGGQGSRGVALTSEGNVICWGREEQDSTLPEFLTSVIAVSCGNCHCAALTQEGKVVCWGQNNCGQCDVPIDLEFTTAICCGGNHTVALALSGRVSCWGHNSRGQCHVPIDLENVVAVSAGWLHTAAITRDGRVICWGRNDDGQCDVPASLQAKVYDECILL